MKRMRRCFLLLMAVVLCFGAAYCETATEEKAASSFFDSEEINRLIDENYTAVLENGYAELRIPLSVHGITEDVLTENSRQVGRTLLENGYKAYVVGGCIRDFIMGKESNDIDISTDATIEQQRALFGDALVTHDVGGMVFGYVQFPDEAVDLATFQNVPAPYAGLPGIPDFDVTTNTSDSEMLDSFQRDMTMNALYYDLSTGDIVDFHGGIHDIREGVINTMVDASIALPVRPRVTARAIRFKARYGFEFSESLDRVIRESGKELLQAMGSGDLYVNICQMMDAGYSLDCWHNLREYGLMDTVYPVLGELNGDPAYDAYLEKALAWMDQLRKETGENVSDYLALLVFIQPAIDRLATGADYEAALDSVLDEEAASLDIAKGRDRIREISLLEHDMEQAFSAAAENSIRSSEAFDEALALLNMKALSDETLAEAAGFWNGAAEMEAMIAAAAAEAREKGWYELRIPESLHHVDRGYVSENALAVAQKLMDEGYQAYIIGGAVRDMFLGVPSNDFDIATDAPAELWQQLFGDELFMHGAESTSVQFGVMYINGEGIDLAPLRNIPDYLIGQPGVPEADPGYEISDSPLLDSYGRDLTINALYYDLTTHDIIDYHGGLQDIRDKVLRTIGDPEVVLPPGPSQIIRFIRFLSRYEGSTFAPDLAAALEAHCMEYARMTEPSAAQNQLRRLWIGGYAVTCFDRMQDYGLIGYFYPPVSDLCGDEAYRSEVREALAALDAEYARGGKVETYMGTAEILLPAVRELALSMSAEDAVEETLTQMETVYGFYMDERDLTAQYLLELLAAEIPEAA